MVSRLNTQKIVIILFFCTFAIQGYAQRRSVLTNELATMMLDQTTMILDQATISVYYRFTQQALFANTPTVMTDTTVLRIGSVYSVYYSRSSFIHDSIYTVIWRSINFDQLRGIYHNGRGTFDSEAAFRNSSHDFRARPNPQRTRFFKNRQTNTVTSVDGYPLPGTAWVEFLGTFLVRETISPQEWTILPDTMTILNYLCFKATTEFRGRRYIAWFAPDIPINEGPWKIYGLPGLILRLEDEDGLFVHEAIGLTSHFETPIMINTDYTIVTNEQLQQWIENRRRTIQRTGVTAHNTLFIDIIRNEWSFHQREIGD